MTTYAVRISFTDRREGPGTGRSLSVSRGSFPTAVSQAVRMFWKELDTKQRNDVRRSGLKVEARIALTQSVDA
jgi:hypothetical protein